MNERLKLASIVTSAAKKALQAISIEAETSVTFIDNLAEKERREGKKKRKESFRSWIAKSLLKGASATHKFTNAANTPPSLKLTVRTKNHEGHDETKYITDPYRGGCISRRAIERDMGVQ